MLFTVNNELDVYKRQNQYKMKVAGNLFLPKNMKEGDRYPAIIVGHPMGCPVSYTHLDVYKRQLYDSFNN